MIKLTRTTLASCLLTFTVAGCNTDDKQPESQTLPDEQNAMITTESRNGDVSDDSSQWTTNAALTNGIDGHEQSGSPSTSIITDDIPYPVYPNGSRYRIGGEGDLTIVLFQTEDTFEDVDAYYQKTANMPRLSAMSGYVRYSTRSDDIDPWETSRPGIVIHEFNDATEREAVGADDNARTNIIMSFE